MRDSEVCKQMDNGGHQPKRQIQRAGGAGGGKGEVVVGGGVPTKDERTRRARCLLPGLATAEICGRGRGPEAQAKEAVHLWLACSCTSSQRGGQQRRGSKERQGARCGPSRWEREAMSPVGKAYPGETLWAMMSVMMRASGTKKDLRAATTSLTR